MPDGTILDILLDETTIPGRVVKSARKQLRAEVVEHFLRPGMVLVERRVDTAVEQFRQMRKRSP